MICNRCQKRPAREGFKACAACAATASSNMRKLRIRGGDAHRSKQRAWTRQSEERRRPALIAAGICTHCQYKPAKPGTLWCAPCRQTSDRSSKS